MAWKPANRFNEAPIHESGKFADDSGRPTATTGFNEAPIHESGKYAGHPGPAGRDRPASMRPRFMNRGSPNEAAPSRTRNERLQ